MSRTPSQEKSLKYVQTFVKSRLDKNPEYGDVISEVDVQDLKYFISVRIRTEMLALPPTNYLRYISAQFWVFHIGRNGGIKVSMCPQSYDQFYKRRVHGMVFLSEPYIPKEK